MASDNRSSAASRSHSPSSATSASSVWSGQVSRFPPPSAETTLPFPPSKLRLARGERGPARLTRTKLLGATAAVWGIGGLLLILIYAVIRLVPIASESRHYALDWTHWSALGANTLLMAYMEGYRGFQKSLAPRVVSRARELSQRPSITGAIFAPAYCYGILHAPAREIVARTALIAMIVAFIFGMRMLDNPWRNLLDVGVVVGLSWGIVAICVNGWQAMRGDTNSRRRGAS